MAHGGTVSLPNWHTELYLPQLKHWPEEGKHILAQYDEDSVVVYQAYNPTIAQYAVDHQCFGGPEFSYGRMSWIKTNFLWMMYRSGWASKKNQERILAVRIKREGFEEILANAYTVNYQKQVNVSTDAIEVRLQWDPDHKPNYESCQRKAIQLGLKHQILKKYGTEWIVDITDITQFVKEQRKNIDKNNLHDLMVSSERVYSVSNEHVIARIELDHYEEKEKTPVSKETIEKMIRKPTNQEH